MGLSIAPSMHILTQSRRLSFSNIKVSITIYKAIKDKLDSDYAGFTHNIIIAKSEKWKNTILVNNIATHVTMTMTERA